MKIIFSEKCLEYKKDPHPESPERVKQVYEFLKNKYEFVRPKKCEENNILLVHRKGHLEKIKRGGFAETETPNLPKIYDYARLSVGAAIKACETAIKGEEAFSLMRPPGHHAGKNTFGGFCYFNNLAVAVAKTRKKTAILDFDLHHGNGTQDIFRGKSNVLFISLHQVPAYPGTGLDTKRNYVNYPLPTGTDDRLFLRLIKESIKRIKTFQPELLAISAGFDMYKKDPLSMLNIGMKTYRKIGKLLSEINVPKFAVLEGGYSKDMKYCVHEFLSGLAK